MDKGIHLHILLQPIYNNKQAFRLFQNNTQTTLFIQLMNNIIDIKFYVFTNNQKKEPEEEDSFQSAKKDLKFPKTVWRGHYMQAYNRLEFKLNRIHYHKTKEKDIYAIHARGVYSFFFPFLFFSFFFLSFFSFLFFLFLCCSFCSPLLVLFFSPFPLLFFIFSSVQDDAYGSFEISDGFARVIQNRIVKYAFKKVNTKLPYLFSR